MKNIDEKLGSNKTEPVEKKTVGRPAGTYESKRQQYFMICLPLARYQCQKIPLSNIIRLSNMILKIPTN